MLYVCQYAVHEASAFASSYSLLANGLSRHVKCIYGRFTWLFDAVLWWLCFSSEQNMLKAVYNPCLMLKYLHIILIDAIRLYSCGQPA